MLSHQHINTYTENSTKKKRMNWNSDYTDDWPSMRFPHTHTHTIHFKHDKRIQLASFVCVCVSAREWLYSFIDRVSLLCLFSVLFVCSFRVCLYAQLFEETLTTILLPIGKLNLSPTLRPFHSTIQLYTLRALRAHMRV